VFVCDFRLHCLIFSVGCTRFDTVGVEEPKYGESRVPSSMRLMGLHVLIFHGQF
jgi:hypothetical protein